MKAQFFEKFLDVIHCFGGTFRAGVVSPIQNHRDKTSGRLERLDDLEQPRQADSSLILCTLRILSVEGAAEADVRRAVAQGHVQLSGDWMPCSSR